MPDGAKLTLDDAEIILEPKPLTDASLLVPQTPLISGRLYVFSYSDSWGVVAVHRFTATPAAVTPRVIGSLQASASRQGPFTVSSGGGSCTLDIDAAVADLEINPSPELAPWVSVTRFTTLVDGKVCGHTPASVERIGLRRAPTPWSTGRGSLARSSRTAVRASPRATLGCHRGSIASRL